MRPRLLLLVAMLSAGCAGRSVIAVSVGSDEQIVGVERFVVSAESGAEVAFAFFVPTGAPVNLPPRQTFNLVLEPDRSGSIAITVEALDVEGVVVGWGETRGEAVPGERRDATVMLSAP